MKSKIIIEVLFYEYRKIKIYYINCIVYGIDSNAQKKKKDYLQILDKTYSRIKLITNCFFFLCFR